ncbi:Repeat domain-containing protein [Lysobacter sp. cf310]|nr:Repeat domain-containing protein [Lysobacter sp. cf310]
MWMVGCSSESEPGLARNAAAIRAPDRFEPASLSVGRAPGQGFASLPDRGALARYDDLTRPEVRGALTYRAVELSEAHAFKATVPGSAITLTAPDGRPMRIAYQRHEENQDGNWTWIGQTEDGLQAVITFGEKAVFGRIEQRGTAALGIDTRNGRSWLVQSDPSKLLDGRLLNPGQSDALLAPAAAAIAAASADVTPLATASSTIDLALGYTPGMAARYGGTSQVNTRLTYLVALTNQAYQASKVFFRIRLVHTMPVDYTDTAANPLALRELTGYTCADVSCASQPIPTSLQALRDARETYGADLVSLVRPFVAPQQGSCGAAWINTPSISNYPLDSIDEKFGYSVVSDGGDLNESDGRYYSCVEHTLAHELGHNMGQQHNMEDPAPGGVGAADAYGYREAEADGFYTIMAVPLAGGSQFPIPYFSNPNVNHPATGRPVGTYSHNNAKNLNRFMRDIVKFRVSVIPPTKRRVSGDLNGDGRSDLIWYNPSQSLMAYWWINNTTVLGSGVFSVGSSFKIAGTGDFDGDGLSDILWKDEVDDKVYVWRNLGNGQFFGAYVSAPYQLPTWATGWTVIGSSYDFNEDGNDDIVWRDSTGKYRIIWLMNGTTKLRSHASAWGPSPPFEFTAVGDFDGDHNGDLISVDPTQNWLMLSSNDFGDSETYTHGIIGNYDPAWKLVGVTDLNGDGRSDLLWENPSQGLMAYWWMNGFTIQSSGVKVIDPAYRIAATGDYNGDGLGDILWTNATTGLIFLWLSRGDGEFDTPFLASYSTAWSLIP